MIASIRIGDQTLDGPTLLERATRAAGGLALLGVGEGDVLATFLRNGSVAMEAVLAARVAGCFLCPTNWHLKADEAGYILRDSGASALLVHADLLPGLDGAVPDGMRVIVVEPEPAVCTSFGLTDAATCAPLGLPEWERWLDASPPLVGPPRAPRPPIFYSSGTTGRPRGIKRELPTAEHVARTAERVRLAYGVEPGARTAAIAPIYHAAPAVHAMHSLISSELIVVHPRFDPELLLADIERHRLTSLLLVPTMFIRLLRLPAEARRRYDLSSLRNVACMGSPCPAEVKWAMIEWLGPIVTEIYASSETGALSRCSGAEALERPGTVGRLLPHVEVRILDEDGGELPPMAAGAIYCRQAAYPDFTYLNDDAARRRMECRGMITVGDIGYLDDAGYLYLCDRKADLVISGGVNIYPAEIEAVLIRMPGVADCAVFGIPDPEFGEALAAHVQPLPGVCLSKEAVIEFVGSRLAGFKVPRVVEFSLALPREETGKIFKRRLREPYWQGLARQI